MTRPTSNSFELESSHIIHGTCWLIFAVGMVVLDLTQVTVFMLVLFVRLFMNVRCVLLDVFWAVLALCNHELPGGLPAFHPCIVTSRLSHQQRSSFAIQGVGRVRIPKELWQEDLENVDHVKHGRPGLVDNIKADRTGSRDWSAVPALGGRSDALFVYVGMENPVHESNGGRFVWVLVWQLHVDFPPAIRKWCCKAVSANGFCSAGC